MAVSQASASPPSGSGAIDGAAAAPSRTSTLLPPPASSATPAASLKSLGKRRQTSPPLQGSSVIAEPAAVVKREEKRVTRSSLGGANDTSRETSTAPGASVCASHLPVTTAVSLSLKRPEGLTYHPPPSADAIAAAASASTSASTDRPPPPTYAPTERGVSKLPPFRLLTLEDSFGRSRHAGAAEYSSLLKVDMSDTFYSRLHRFPEVLEKRSARLERDRLIHERSKLIAELEDLRGRGWVYIGAQGGRGEEERRRKIKEGEERLRRYDALLPNQPRKSGMLNLGPHAVPTGTSSDHRADSQAATLLAAKGGPRTGRASTPVSASGDGGMKIKIKFGGLSSSAPANVLSRPEARGATRSESRRGYSDSSSYAMDVDSDSAIPTMGRTDSRPYRKRDRKAEKERAAERIRLGLPRGSLLPSQLAEMEHERRAEAFAQRHPSRAVWKARSSQQSESPSLDNDDEDEEDELASEEEDDHRAPAIGRGKTHLPRPSPRTSTSVASVNASPRAPRINKRILKNSFFDSDALRESVFNSQQGGRRSGRVAYAFGQRVADSSIPHKEFELVGGVESGDDESTRLEELVRTRMASLGGEVGERPTLVNGVQVPSSALAVLRQTVPAARQVPTTVTAVVPPIRSPELFAHQPSPAPSILSPLAPLAETDPPAFPFTTPALAVAPPPRSISKPLGVAPRGRASLEVAALR